MSDDNKSVAELAAETKAVFERRQDEVKVIAEKALAEAAKGIDMTASVKELADQALKAVNEARADWSESQARLAEVEQKMARQRDEAPASTMSPGYQVIGSEDVKSFMANPTGGKRVGVEVKAIISGLGTDAMGSAGDLVVPQRLGILDPVERRMTVRDLLMQGRTNSSSIQYPKETGFTNAAATHSETSGAVKPDSDIKFDLVTANVTTIAHWVLATRQILDDAPMLQSYIDGRLRYGLRFVEEDQLLNGAGTGTTLHGVRTQASTFAAGTSIVANPQALDVIRYAMLQGELAEFPASGIVLNPRDWAGMETVKDTVGRYIIGNPQQAGQPRLWGLPVVATQSIPAGNFLTGAFNLAAQIFDRQDARVEISTEDAENFRKNLVTILAEQRLALAVYRPEAFIKGTFAAAITDLTS
jgi:HK97 family phage major capsid protein